MAIRTTFLAWGLGLLLTLSADLVSAQQFERVGDYQIHYSAVNTSFLTPEVAAAYDIQRSQVQALLSISVRQELDDGSTRAVNATVNGQVSNLAGQIQELSFRTVREDEAIYHLATFRIQEDEALRFNLDVTYDRNQEPANISFMQRFYFDR
ncbi:hypothetical protein L861_08110 [Litchfieldella anticariensis FP35 = DSM 16096]|uniref:DUF4426 domain-containing protein n=1 Tax=Litchfieldella anticariensis (strain DSM 16096 / CECT 5854 / CIP 108499 / LMG 22089 / FP35) TaxID=1121939 RepID=S2KXH0_LITA3|nr:DUF4426 domain-containing protein [Halomonas anticariensis]EPC00119.1 hypothetical protein L861_08110 [Halomonas anticariensis FP35 = DSM 16096]